VTHPPVVEAGGSRGLAAWLTCWLSDRRPSKKSAPR